MTYFMTVFDCSPALTFINLANAYTKSDLQVMNNNDCKIIEFKKRFCATVPLRFLYLCYDQPASLNMKERQSVSGAWSFQSDLMTSDFFYKICDNVILALQW